MKRKALTQKQYEYLMNQMQTVGSKWLFFRLFLSFPEEAIIDTYKDKPGISSYYGDLLKDFNKNRVKKTYEMIESVAEQDTPLARELALIDVNKGRLLHAKRAKFAEALDGFMHIRQDLYTIALQYLDEELCVNDNEYEYISFEELNKDIIGE